MNSLVRVVMKREGLSEEQALQRIEEGRGLAEAGYEAGYKAGYDVGKLDLTGSRELIELLGGKI